MKKTHKKNSHLETRKKVRKTMCLGDKGRGGTVAILRYHWCQTFYLGWTCSLHALVCHGGHASSRLGSRGRVILNPINNHHIYLWGWDCAGLVCIVTHTSLLSPEDRQSLSEVAVEEESPHFLVDSLWYHELLRGCEETRQLKCNMWPCYWLLPFVTFQL